MSRRVPDAAATLPLAATVGSYAAVGRWSCRSVRLDATMDPGIAELRRMIEEAQRIVVFTGAGISTESGIPDFRSPGGIWTKMRPIYFDDFMSSEEMRRESWRRKFATDETMLKAEPNAGHRALARLVELGKMTAIITQNVDGL